MGKYSKTNFVINVVVITLCLIVGVLAFVKPLPNTHNVIEEKQYTDVLLLSGNNKFIPTGYLENNGVLINYKYFAKQQISLSTTGGSATYCYKLIIKAPAVVDPNNKIYLTLKKDDLDYLEKDITGMTGEIILVGDGKIKSNIKEVIDMYYVTLDTSYNIEGYELDTLISKCD